MSAPTFLREPSPPGPQVAAALLAGRQVRPVDLGDTWVIVPTSGAARCIRHHLAVQAGGVLAPRFCLPMEALLPAADDLADATERELIWARVLRTGKRGRFASLVPPAVQLDDSEDLLGVAGRFSALCDTLAEAGLAPGAPELVEACGGDAARWRAFAGLHEEYLAALAAAGRRDPNQAKLMQAREPVLPPGLKRVVVACVADLPRIAERFLARIAEAGVEVEVLVWQPADGDGSVDAWGRPDPAWWGSRLAHVPEDCIVAVNTAADEAAALLDQAAERGGEGFALVAAAPECLVPLSAEVARRGAVPYSPEGRPLALTEAATILRGWDEFVRSGRLRTLRQLLDLPAFAQALGKQGGALTPADALEACDWLMADRLCDTLDAARAWHRGAPEGGRRDRERRQEAAGRLIMAAESLLRLGADAALWASAGRADEVEALDEVLDSVELSGLVAEETADWRQSLLRRAIGRARVFESAPAGAVQIAGWLEAAWSDAPLVCVAGCREGALPSGTGEDAFLPDGIRAALGLQTQASRLARDAFLLAALLASRGPGGVMLGVSRFRAGGEPNRPSRLLLACADDDLPSRVRRIFHPPAPCRPSLPPSPFKLRFDVKPPPESLSATAFKRYLQCPLRFYLSRVAGWEAFDDTAREINAADFGTIMHAVLDRFHKLGVSDSADEKTIADFLGEELDREIVRQYGSEPSPVVRVQAGFMHARLRAFAPAQAAARREGWCIIETEHGVKREDGHRIGPLALTGVMDRVEVHPELGLRILDYKTFGRPKTPEETHFARPHGMSEWEATKITRSGKKGQPVARVWSDLQLPLYRRLAATIWPEHAERGLRVGYVLLPAEEIEEPFVTLDLDDDAFDSAMKCAAEVADRVARGVFWPPTPADRVEHDDLESWFGGDDPAALLDPETIRQLEGRP